MAVNDEIFSIPPKVVGDAQFSDCGTYRYTLTRDWDCQKPRVCFIMLNPSKAGIHMDDPTTRRCVAFARAWGFGRYIAVNLFAVRSPDPNILRSIKDPIGPANDNAIAVAVAFSDQVVIAWGHHGYYMNRGSDVLGCLSFACAPGKVKCLGWTKGGHPRFPLYAPKDASLQDVEL